MNCSTSGLKRFYLILESNWLTDHKFPNSLQGWVMPPKKNLDDIPPPPPHCFFLNQADRPSPSNPNCFAVTPRPQTILNRTALMSFDSPLGLRHPTVKSLPRLKKILRFGKNTDIFHHKYWQKYWFFTWILTSFLMILLRRNSIIRHPTVKSLPRLEKILKIGENTDLFSLKYWQKYCFFPWIVASFFDNLIKFFSNFWIKDTH